MASFLAENGDFYVFLNRGCGKKFICEFFLPQITRMARMIAHSIFNRDGL